jgi:hypothetical protein
MTPDFLARRVDTWLFADESAGRLRIARAGLAALVALRLAFNPYAELSEQPAALFRPVWFLSLLDRMPPAGVLLAIQIVGVAAAILAVLGWRERGTFLAAWMSLLVLGGLRGSRGKITHNDVLLLLVGALFVIAPVGLRALDRRRSPAYGWPIRGSMVVIAGCYFLTGFQKVVASGPAWVLSDNMQNVMLRSLASGKPGVEAVPEFIASHPLIAHLAAAATLAIELGAVLILFVPWVRPIWAAAAVALHLSIWMTLGLDYTAWAGVVLVIVIPWDQVTDRLAGRRERWRVRWFAVPR